MPRAHKSRLSGRLSLRFPILVMHFLIAFQRTAQDSRHHLGMFGNVAISMGVRMGGFEKIYIPSVDAPTFHFAKRC
jgi:hypothetical protein